ncbi:DUF6320 domain-containing protein [Papillibacter cinnamivorans]|uniref:Uncharacterized protein n=1 Tax=Papillibacter cinnamivorans DSM 12816 TaxID=1122930 RepID=A0A1W2AWE1_9FIRM|nr:DUF6320 domain-containing protein [Papillibacter cinnamivorans]SMC65025.1 hypothetical protein SAMN02745168_2002 [Papillibacter cinnamivorans DSM 12816]
MSYCVNCGVELHETAGECPLCKTPVRNPKCPADTVSPKPYPADKGEVPPVSRREIALIVSAMLASVSAACGLLNLLVLNPGRGWSLYIIGACVMLWVILVPPFLTRRARGLPHILMDGCAVALYVGLISLDLRGADWYTAVALPLIGGAMVFVSLLYLLLHRRRRSLLTGIISYIGAAGVYSLGVEWILDRYLIESPGVSWSLVVCTICAALMIPLIVVRRRPALREEARRRFHV